MNKCTKHILIAMLSVFLSAGSSTGQNLRNPVTVNVIPIQNLNFGDLIAGVPKHISYTDPISAGEFEIKVTHGTSIMALISSPAWLNGHQSATLTLSYTANDGYYNSEPKLTGGTTFNPFFWPFLLNPGHTYYFYIGGTAQPSQTQPSGSYSGLITVQVVYF